MRGIFLLVVVALIVLAVYFTVRAVRRRREARLEWTVALEETIDSTEVWLVKGRNAKFEGRALRSAEDYGGDLFRIQNNAEDKAIDWNSAERVARKHLTK